MYERMSEKHAPAYIREAVAYDTETGCFVWLARPRSHFSNDIVWRRWQKVFAGKVCGSAVEGRWVICVNGIKYPATHIAWVISHGEWPSKYVDHISGDQLDNRLVNLRAVDEAENSRNCRLYKTNKSGVHGVYKSPRGNWYSQIGIGGKKVTLGYFDTFEAAKAARLKAEREYGFHPNHGRTAPVIGEAA